MPHEYGKYVRGATYLGVALVWVVIGWGNASLIISIFMISYTTIVIIPWLTGFLYSTITLALLYLTRLRWQEKEHKACVILGANALFMMAINFAFLWVTITASALGSDNVALMATIHALPFSLTFLSGVCALLPFTTAFFLLHSLVKEQARAVRSSPHRRAKIVQMPVQQQRRYQAPSPERYTRSAAIEEEEEEFLDENDTGNDAYYDE
jgi:hypothetical protein